MNEKGLRSDKKCQYFASAVENAKGCNEKTSLRWSEIHIPLENEEQPNPPTDGNVLSGSQSDEEYMNCDQCDESFVRRWNLQEHKKEVNEGRKFDCPECDNKYATKKFLNQHVQVHHRGIYFVCSICDKKYATKYRFNKHVKICKRSLSKHATAELEASYNNNHNNNNSYSPIKEDALHHHQPDKSNHTNGDEGVNTSPSSSSVNNEQEEKGEEEKDTSPSVLPVADELSRSTELNDEMQANNSIAETTDTTETTTTNNNNNSNTTPVITDLFSLFFVEVSQLIHTRLALCEFTYENMQMSCCNMKNWPTMQTVATSKGLPIEDILALYSALVYLAMILRPNNCAPLIDICLNATADSLHHVGLSLSLLDIMQTKFNPSYSPYSYGTRPHSAVQYGNNRNHICKTNLIDRNFGLYFDLLDKNRTQDSHSRSILGVSDNYYQNMGEAIASQMLRKQNECKYRSSRLSDIKLSVSATDPGVSTGQSVDEDKASRPGTSSAVTLELARGNDIACELLSPDSDGMGDLKAKSVIDDCSTLGISSPELERTNGGVGRYER
ncbi:unnamed protein product [Trichobilharzia szidati]|nr:unnamed protein product [Trichobilharzia szidati]